MYLKCYALDPVTVQTEIPVEEIVDLLLTVTDSDEMTGMGAMMMPALMIDGSIVLSGKTSSSEEIKKILETIQ